MQIFLSWSGELSREIAEIFYNWLPSVLQNVEPYFSVEDIEKGEKWIANITKNLNDTSIGLIFVTKENEKAPWINYEAGALSNSLEMSNVCPLLIDIKKGNINSRSPLFHYQATEMEKEDILKLLTTINNRQKDRQIKDKALNKAFEWAWPELKERIDAVKNKYVSTSFEKEEIKEENAIEEVLALLRSIKKEQTAVSSEEKHTRIYVRFTYEKQNGQITDNMLKDEISDIINRFDGNGYLLLLEHNNITFEIDIHARVRCSTGESANLLVGYFKRGLNQLGFKGISMQMQLTE